MGKYVQVSIPRNGDGAGTPKPKDTTIILVDVEDIATEPTREIGNVVTLGELTLSGGAKAVGIYATPSTVDCGYTNEGEIDAKGFKHKVSFEHPGDSDAVNNFNEVSANKGFVALVKECDGTAEGKVKIYGSKCNPLRLEIENTDNKESQKNKMTFSQQLLGPFVPGVYGGAMPALADPAGAAAAGETV